MGTPQDDLDAIAARESARARREAPRPPPPAPPRDDRRAPTAFHRTTRAFALGMLQLLALAAFAGLWLEGVDVTTWLLAFEASWLLVSGAVLLDHHTWRARLPFELQGYDTIEGTDTTDDDTAPFVHVRVTIEADGDLTPAHTALVILATRMNRTLQSDSDTASAKAWQVDGPCAEGEATFSLYTTRVLEAWLRREVCLAAKASPIRRVRVYASYTGYGYRLPID